MSYTRKLLMLGTCGMSALVVNPNSKKERTAKASKKQVKLLKQILAEEQKRR